MLGFTLYPAARGRAHGPSTPVEIHGDWKHATGYEDGYGDPRLRFTSAEIERAQSDPACYLSARLVMSFGSRTRTRFIDPKGGLWLLWRPLGPTVTVATAPGLAPRTE